MSLCAERLNLGVLVLLEEHLKGIALLRRHSLERVKLALFCLIPRGNLLHIGALLLLRCGLSLGHGLVLLQLSVRGGGAGGL